MKYTIRNANENEISTLLEFKDKIRFLTYKEFLNGLNKEAISYSNSIEERSKDTLSKINLGIVEIYVAMDENQTLLGYTKIYKKDNYNEIQDLFIDPQFQGLGIGTALVNKVFENSANKNIFQFKVNVIEKNIKAIQFYYKMGFRQDMGKVYNYRIGDKFRTPTVIMYKVNPSVVAHFMQSARLLLNSLIQHNIPIISLNPLSNNLFASINGNYIYFKGIITPLNHLSAASLANDKLMSKKALELFKIPTPTYICYQKGLTEFSESTKQELKNFITENKRIIAKPQNGLKSKDVFLNITTVEQAIEAYNHINAKNYKGVLFEKYIPGDVHRILMINGKLVAALKREKGYIIGDGIKSIEELAIDKNNYLNHGGRNVGRIIFGEKLSQVVANQGYNSIKEIPTKNEKVFTEIDFSNLETVTEVTNLVNKNLVEKLGKFANKIGLGLTGIDVISEDITDEKRSSVIEINKEPSIDFHHYPDYGNSIDVAGAIVDAIIAKYS